VSLWSLRIDGQDAELELRLLDQDAWAVLSRWAVRAREPVDSCVGADHGMLDLRGRDHVSVRQNTDPRVELWFRGTPDDPARLRGRLAQGPAFLLGTYAAVLEEEGLRTRIGSHARRPLGGTAPGSSCRPASVFLARAPGLLGDRTTRGRRLEALEVQLEGLQ